MLFLIMRPDLRKLETMKLMAGDEEKTLVLASDAVYLARPSMLEVIDSYELEEIYADAQAVQARGVVVSDRCQVVNMDRIVDLVTDSGKLVNL